MTSRRYCPTPRKPKYTDRLFAESLVIQCNYNWGYNNEVYECGDHYHIRDRAKRKRVYRAKEATRKANRRKFQQLTIYDWMAQLNGSQGI